MADPGTIYTIGYEGRSPEDFLALLRANDVQQLVDTRLRAASRKRGFSRRALSEELAAGGIEYRHAVALGTPAEMMKERQALGAYDLERYAQHLDALPELLEQTAAGVEGRRVALMCFELDPATCHRTVVASRLARLTGGLVRHL